MLFYKILENFLVTCIAFYKKNDIIK